MELISPVVKAARLAAGEDPEGFWARAADGLPWFRRWDRVFDWDPERPDERGRYFRWFSDSPGWLRSSLCSTLPFSPSASVLKTVRSPDE